uniref:Plastid lipid-associated protein/fibrillin conserved domain-containing protein n=1 Tax=Oryza punctata TaxID=4537 RepID=A0A0E0M9K2_ORYPU
MALAAAPLLRLPISLPSPPPPPLLACNSIISAPPLSNGVRLRPQRSRQPRLAAAAAATASLATPSSPAADTERRKHELLRAVQETGRGFAASPDQRAAIEEAIVSVEELGAGEGSPLDLAALDGTWRLCYTSASDVLVLFEASERFPLLQVGQIYQKFECRDRSDGGVVRNVVRWSIENLLEEQEGATLMVSAKFAVMSKRNIFLQFEEVAVENIKISEQLQALIAPAILPRSFFSLQILQFLKTFRAQVPVNGPERRSPGGLYYLSYLDRDMLLGRSVGGGGSMPAATALRRPDDRRTPSTKASLSESSLTCCWYSTACVIASASSSPSCTHSLSSASSATASLASAASSSLLITSSASLASMAATFLAIFNNNIYIYIYIYITNVQCRKSGKV